VPLLDSVAAALGGWSSTLSRSALPVQRTVAPQDRARARAGPGSEGGCPASTSSQRRPAHSAAAATASPWTKPWPCVAAWCSIQATMGGPAIWPNPVDTGAVSKAGRAARR